ncbi:acyltransferase domain-containing protein, partial [Streptomyces palmae]
QDPTPTLIPWTISARTDQALRDQAAALAEHLRADTRPTPAEVGWSLLRHRTVFERRAVVLGENRDQLLDGLDALVTGQPHPGVVEPSAEGGEGPGTGKTVWVFSGQGSQRPGMGADLYHHFPTFAETFDEISEHLNPHLNHPLQDITFNRNPNQPDLIHHTTYTQTSLFALHISLARLLTTLGLTPDAVIGHSIGEISAAHIAGILNLPDACHLIATRATLMGQLPPNGTMTAIQATPTPSSATPSA